jgi:LDH2 family malate/lactate/ureidoglycolate dehydrogenase
MNQHLTAKYEATALRNFAKALLLASGLDDERAFDVADVLLEGDLLGHTTHGLALLPLYLEALRENAMEKTGEPEIVADHGAALTWEGRYLPGPWLVRRAIRVAQDRLAANPITTVVIRRSHHIACLQAYLKPVTDAGLIILLYSSDPHSRVVTPHGGTAPRYSPNPIAAGIPTNGAPILIDISTSSTAHGFCKRLAAAGERLPGEWAVDRNGNPTNDPQVVSDENGGGILPLGGTDLGHKGFALGLIVEALSNALSGFGRADDPQRWNNSVFLQLINPAGFGGREAFLRETGFVAQFCKDSPAPSGKSPVRIPGEAALARRATQLASGVELHPTIMPSLSPWAESLKIKPPPRLTESRA